MALLDLQQFFPAAGATAEPPDLNDPVILREIRRRLIEAGQANAGSGGPTLGTPDIMANIAPPPMGSDAPQGAPLATQDIAPGPQAGTAYRAPQPQSDGVAEARALNQSVIDRAAPGSMAPRRTPQAPPADAGPSPLESLGAILAGGGDRRQGVIGRIGGMIQGGTGLDRGRDTENLTVRALMSRGLDQDTATVIARNPDLLKSVAPTLLGAGRNWTTTEVYDAQGRRQRVAVNTADPRQTIPLGGPQADQLEQNITRDQARADNQEIQKLRTNASRSGEIVNSLDRMRQLRKGVSYEGIPLVSQALADRKSVV